MKNLRSDVERLQLGRKLPFAGPGLRTTAMTARVPKAD